MSVLGFLWHRLGDEYDCVEYPTCVVCYLTLFCSLVPLIIWYAFETLRRYISDEG